MHPAIPLGVTAVIAFAAGFAFSTLTAPDPVSQPFSSAAATQGSAKENRPGFLSSAPSRADSARYLASLANADADALVEELNAAMDLPNPMRRFARITLISEQVTAENGREVAEKYLATATTTERRWGIMVILNSWAMSDPKGALEFARSIK